MGDILSQLPQEISLYFDISLIIVVVIWEVRNVMGRRGAVQLHVYAQAALVLRNSSNICILVSLQSRDRVL